MVHLYRANSHPEIINHCGNRWLSQTGEHHQLDVVQAPPLMFTHLRRKSHQDFRTLRDRQNLQNGRNGLDLELSHVFIKTYKSTELNSQAFIFYIVKQTDKYLAIRKKIYNRWVRCWNHRWFLKIILKVMATVSKLRKSSFLHAFWDIYAARSF